MANEISRLICKLVEVRAQPCAIEVDIYLCNLCEAFEQDFELRKFFKVRPKVSQGVEGD